MSILHNAKGRHALRRSVRIACQVVCEESFTLLARECVDLSLTGMAVRALAPAREGTPLIVSFRIPGSSLVVDADAVVARVARGRRVEDRGALLGVRFLALDPIDRAILAARLRGLPPPVPARPLRVDYALTVLDIAGFGQTLDVRAA